MKIMKCIVSFLISILLLSSCGSSTQNVVEGLSGNVTMDGYEGRKVYLETTDASSTKVDSAIVTDGKFMISFNDSLPKVYRLVLSSSDEDVYPITLPVVSEKGQVKVSMGELVLTSGTPMNDALQDFLLAVSNFTDKVMKEENPDMKKIVSDFGKLVEGSVLSNINTPVGVYIYRAYEGKLDDQQKSNILTRGGDSFKKALTTN